MKQKRFSANIVILLVVIAVYSYLCLTVHQYTRLTADSMLYFSIAQKYVNGDFHNAINGYWGPLLAWLLIPFVYFDVKDVTAINIIDTIIGVSTITGCWILSHRFLISEKVRAVLLISLLPIALKFSLVQPMDFLLVCILIFYLCIIFRSDYPGRISYGILSGILGALAYFTKAYAFPFFIVHFIVMNIFHYFKNISKQERSKVLKNVLAGFLLFFVLSGSWIMIISNKYGHFTFSTMRETNFNAPDPEAMGGGLEFGVPIFYEGFFTPPNKTAFVVWEDPSYLRGKPWSAFHSWSNFKHFIRLLLKNISDSLQIYVLFSSLSVAIIIAYILYLSGEKRGPILQQEGLLNPLFTLFLFSGGYLLFHFEERYLWLANILLLMMGGYVLTDLLKREFFLTSKRKNMMIVFFVISFIFSPSKYVIQAGRGEMESDMYYLSRELRNYNVSGNIASNREFVPVHDAWHKTFRLAYWLQGRYYGQAREGISDKELEIELKKYNIDYYLIWGSEPHIPQFLASAEEVTKGTIPGLNVYSLKNSSNTSQSTTGHER